jgi:outer membrane protein assembly factor BamE (lipoprotein component of BamABCDE complex)
MSETIVFSMKAIKYVSFVTLLTLLVGCATTFRPWKLTEIQEGMDRAQVTEILGEPDSIEVKEGSEFLYYSYRENNNIAPADSDFRAYDADRAMRDLQIQSSFKEYQYVVKMAEGKVQTYKEL